MKHSVPLVTSQVAPARAAAAKPSVYIGLPFEQRPNPDITPELCFEFHYFFMRKFWV